MGRLRDRMEQDLILRKLSPSTRRHCLLYSRKFVAHYRRSPEELGEPEIRDYLLHLIEVERVSYATYRQIVAALKFLYTATLARRWEVDRIPFPRYRRDSFPEVLGQDKLVALFAALRRLKYRALLMSCYAGGLRISEACALRVEDIDSKRRVIRVRYAKGNKQRYTVLSQQLLIVLREYWKAERPPEWLFPGRGKLPHISPSTLRTVFRKARRLLDCFPSQAMTIEPAYPVPILDSSRTSVSFLTRLAPILHVAAPITCGSAPGLRRFPQQRFPRPSEPAYDHAVSLRPSEKLPQDHLLLPRFPDLPSP